MILVHTTPLSPARHAYRLPFIAPFSYILTHLYLVLATAGVMVAVPFFSCMQGGYACVPALLPRVTLHTPPTCMRTTATYNACIPYGSYLALPVLTYFLPSVRTAPCHTLLITLPLPVHAEGDFAIHLV